MATKAKQAKAQKEELIAEYLRLDALKLGFTYDENDAFDVACLALVHKKSVLELKAAIAKMSRMADYVDDGIVVPEVMTQAEMAAFAEGHKGKDGSTYSRFAPTAGKTLTEKQEGLIIRLTIEKHGTDLLAEGNEGLLEMVKKLTPKKASEAIDRLIKAPRFVAPVAAAPAKAEPTAPVATMADGIYAIEDDEIKCYEIEHGKAGGKWEGFTFLSRVSSDDRWPIKNHAEKARILAAIQQDVEAAGVLAAQVLRQCRGASERGRKCRRTLTDTNNPYFPYGYGPECGPRCYGDLPEMEKPKRTKKAPTAKRTIITEPVTVDEGPVVVQAAQPSMGYAIPLPIAKGPAATKAQKVWDALAAIGENVSLGVSGETTVLEANLRGQELKVTWNGTSFCYGAESTLGGKRFRNVSELLRLIG